MTRYDESLPIPYAFPPQLLENTLGEVLARSGMRQLRLAETEKYAHVTFFFSGREEKPFPGESRRLVPSPKVPTYDQKPEMSAQEVTNEALKEIASGLYDVVVLNYANCDMVGHTGSLDAAVRAVETVDGCLGRVVKAALRAGGSVVVCADHGNAEQMVEEDSGEPHTAHTSNPVPCIFADERLRDLHVRGKLMVRDGVLGNVSPSILEILGLPKPGDMECGSLIEHREA